MLHAKFQNHWTPGSEKDLFKGIYHIRARRPSLSFDLDHLYKLSFFLSIEVSREICF